MSASADVLAMAKVEVDLNAIPEGKNVRASPHQYSILVIYHSDNTNLSKNRSLSSGVVSRSSSDTELKKKSRKPRTSRSSH
jgi:hypothetical protein